MYFAQHPIYSTMPEGFIGCDVLVAKLTRILFTHIKHNMPTMVGIVWFKTGGKTGPVPGHNRAAVVGFVWCKTSGKTRGPTA